MKHTVQIAVFSMVLFSCTEMPIEEPLSLNKDALSANFLVSLEDGGLPLALVLKDSSLNVNSHWNAAFGRLELTDERGSQIFIVEDSTSCVAKKMDLEGGILNIEYQVDNDSLLSYISKLPGGDQGYPGFFAKRTINGRSYTFENNPIVEYTSKEIQTMIELVMSIEGSKRVLNSQLTEK